MASNSAYGDDSQSAPSYPLVRLVYTATGRVFYARTSGFTGTRLAPNMSGITRFLMPSAAETGALTLTFVANGVASKPENVRMVS